MLILQYAHANKIDLKIISNRAKLKEHLSFL